jgi:hypothetical protein
MASFPPPEISGFQVDWEALARRLLETMGEDPTGLIKPWTPPMMGPPMGGPPMGGAPLPPPEESTDTSAQPPLPPAATPPEGA